MANFQLIDGSGNLMFDAGWDPQAFANLPVAVLVDQKNLSDGESNPGLPRLVWS